MNSNKIHIKSRTPAFIVKGAVFLILMMISLACALLPYLAGVTDGSMNLIRAAGWIVFAVTTAFFIYLVVNEIRPRDAMILDSRGFTENNHLLGASVEWTNVASVGIYGTKENPVFGITFENNDIVINGLRKRAADEMRVNIENNLPSVLISRNEVAVSLKELRDTFNRFIRESRVLKDTAPVKQKTNPFTTEDVLRAFGKIPQEKPAGEKTIVAPEPVKDDTPKFVEVNDGSQPAEKHSGSDFYSALFEDDNSEPEVPSGDTIVVRDRPAVKEEPAVSDTVVFSEKPEPEAPAEEVPEVKERETKPEEQPDIGDFEEYDLPDDLKAILSGKRSEKINKIEKMLENSDVPYSAVRSQDRDIASEPIPEEPSVPVFEVKDEETVPETNEPEIKVPVIEEIEAEEKEEISVPAEPAPSGESKPDRKIIRNKKPEKEPETEPVTIFDTDPEENPDEPQKASAAHAGKNEKQSFDAIKIPIIAETREEQMEIKAFNEIVNNEQKAEEKTEDKRFSLKGFTLPSVLKKTDDDDDDYPSIVFFNEDDE